jgi:hypothetical protein
MAMIAYRETLTLEVRGQRLEMVIPVANREAQAFKQRHVFRPSWEYEAIMAALFERFLGVLDVPQFLDVGAFIGYDSLLSGRLLEGRPGRIVAIESNPGHLALLRENVQLNRLTNVEVVHAALSDREEDLHSQFEMVSPPVAVVRPLAGHLHPGLQRATREPRGSQPRSRGVMCEFIHRHTL